MLVPTDLADLKPVEVSIVPKGANKQKFLIVKEDGGMPNIAIEKALKDAGVKVDVALAEPVVKALEPVLKGMPENSQNVLKAAMQMLKGIEGDLPPDLMKALMDAGGYGNPAPVAAPAPVVPAQKSQPGSPDVGGFAGGMAPIRKEDGSNDWSHVPENVRPTLQAIWKEKEERDTKLAKIEKQLEDERNVRVTKEFVEKAATFKSLGVKTEDLGRVLKEVAEKAPDAFKTLEPMLKGLDEKIAKGGLFTEKGTAAPGDVAATAGQTDAEARIEQIAKGIVEKAGDKPPTKTQAIAKAWEMHPELYAQHRAESDARKRA